MPRWAVGYQARTKQTCPQCGKRKDFYAEACRKCKVYPKPLAGVRGPEHPAWKSGRRIDKDGYIRTYCPDHPWPRRGGYVLEHVRLMELAIGRRIQRDEVVHHVNENRQDNRIENLELKQHGEHSAHHRAKDKHTYRRNPSTGRYARKEVQHAS